MKKISELDALSITLYFICVTLIPMIAPHPWITAVSLVGSAVLVTLREPRGSLKVHLYVLLLFAVLTLVNPIISHKGETILFMVNDSPVTLESFLYGLNSAAALCSVVYWFYSFSKIMDSEKTLRVFGKVSPRAALVMSSALRYIPMIRSQYRKTKTAQKATGLYKDGNIIDLIKGNMRVLSSVISWALENGIVTADSMAARGCGSGRRTAFTSARFGRRDAALCLITAVLSALCWTAAGFDKLDIAFYPKVRMSESSALGMAGITAYIILTVLPSAMETVVNVRWRYLVSKA